MGASAQPTPRERFGSTRCGLRWAGSTAPTGTETWSAAARRSKRMVEAPTWHLWIDQTPRPGWTNMAIDQALLERAHHRGEHWLRLYQWAPHCLSFGRHEPACRRYDAERIHARGI